MGFRAIPLMTSTPTHEMICAAIEEYLTIPSNRRVVEARIAELDAEEARSSSSGTVPPPITEG